MGPSLQLPRATDILVAVSIGKGGAARVEQQIKRARIGGQIAPEQAARLKPDPPGPFQSKVLHPLRRAGAAARQEIEQAPRGLDDSDIAKSRGILLDERLLIGNPKRKPEIVGRQRVDLIDLGAQRFARNLRIRRSQP